MGQADYYAFGQWNAYCHLCGAKQKSGAMTKTWDNHWVCRKHKEVRNPQDFVKGVKDDQSVPWSAPTVLTYLPGSSVVLDVSGQVIRDTLGNPITDKT